MMSEYVDQMTPQQLHEICAEKVMGWREHNEFDTWGSEHNVLWMRQKYETLMGVPFQFGDMIEKGVWSHQWERYQPTTDLVQAFGLLTRLRESRGWNFYISTRHPNHFAVQIEAIATSVQLRLPLAITNACVLAVMLQE